MVVFGPNIQLIEDMRFLVMGFGVTGKAVVDFLLEKTPIQIIIANSGDPEKWKGEDHARITWLDLDQKKIFADALASADFVMRSPGIDPRTYGTYSLMNKEVGEIELAYQYLNMHKSEKDPPSIIAVTGTNGKTTTVSLMDHVLKKAGYQNFLGGNVGTPFIDLFKDPNWQDFDSIVLELSSFQIEQLDTFRASSAAILNLTASHEERYDSPADYFRAKLKLIGHCESEAFYYLKKDQALFQSLLKSEDRHLKFDQLTGIELNCDSNGKQTELSENLDILGQHNLLNALFSYYLLRASGLEVRPEHFSGFYGVSYRLQKRPSRKNRPIFNDAKSTNQEATLTAVNSMQGNFKKFHLIMGGQLRHQSIDFNELFQHVPISAQLHFFGESKDELKRHADLKNLPFTMYQDLNEVMQELRRTSDTEAILFSPGFPSFDQYQNYVQRGKHFDELVEKLEF